jgi:hypothetical protein
MGQDLDVSVSTLESLARTIRDEGERTHPGDGHG